MNENNEKNPIWNNIEHITPNLFMIWAILSTNKSFRYIRFSFNCVLIFAVQLWNKSKQDHYQSAVQYGFTMQKITLSIIDSE